MESSLGLDTYLHCMDSTLFLLPAVYLQTTFMRKNFQTEESANLHTYTIPYVFI